MATAPPTMLIARYPRLGSLIGAVLFGGITFALVDVLFLHRFVVSPTDWSKAPNFIFGLVFLVLMGFGFAVSLKTVIRPSILFFADARGVMLGQGVFWNKHTAMDWPEVASIERGTIRTTTRHSSDIPAVRLTFKRPTGLRASLGFRFAHATRSGNGFIVGENMLGVAADDAIAMLQAMQSSALENGQDAT